MIEYVCGDSQQFPKLFCQGYSYSLFFLNSAIPKTMEIVLSLCKNSSIQICSDGKSPNSEHASDVVFLSEGPGKLKVVLHRLNDSAATFGMFYRFKA